MPSGRIDCRSCRFRVTEILAELDAVVEAVLERITDRLLLQRIVVGSRFAEIGAAIDAAEWIARERHIPRHVLLIALVVDLLVVRQDREAGVGIRPPGQARCDEDLVVLNKIDLGVALPVQSDQAIEPLAGWVRRSADIKRTLIAVVGTEVALDAVMRRRLRPFADHVDDAAGIAGSVKSRRGALQHFQPLKTIGLDFRRGEGGDVGGQPQAVEITRRIEAAHLEGVEELVGAEARHRDARRVSESLRQILRALRHHLIAGDNGHRLRRLQKRSIGLGAADALVSQISADRSGAALDPGAGIGLRYNDLTLHGRRRGPATLLGRARRGASRFRAARGLRLRRDHSHCRQFGLRMSGAGPADRQCDDADGRKAKTLCIHPQHCRRPIAPLGPRLFAFFQQQFFLRVSN
jgi:hypothetical protein